MKRDLKMLSLAASTLITYCGNAHGTRIDSIRSGTLQIPLGGYMD